MIKDKITSDRHSALAANTLKTWSDQINYPTDQDWALSCRSLIIKMYLWLRKSILYQMLQKNIFQVDAKKHAKYWLRKGSVAKIPYNGKHYVRSSIKIFLDETFIWLLHWLGWCCKLATRKINNTRKLVTYDKVHIV